MANTLWDNNLVQFARLLCEVGATCDVLSIEALAQSMDLEVGDVLELFERAHHTWELAKAEVVNPGVMDELFDREGEFANVTEMASSPAYPNGQCPVCGHGLTLFYGTCQNVECQNYGQVVASGAH